MRLMGKIAFAHLEDRAGRLQLFFRVNEIGEERMQVLRECYDLGDFIQASGTMVRTRTGEVTLQVSQFHMLAKALTPLPAAKDEVVDGQVVRHATLADPEVRYRQRYADLAVNPEVREIFQIRAAVVRELRNFLDERGFLEVETPILQPIYGGAAARPSPPTTTSSSRTCSCAFPSSCTLNGCWWAASSGSTRSGATSATRAFPSSTTLSSPSSSSTWPTPTTSRSWS